MKYAISVIIIVIVTANLAIAQSQSTSRPISAVTEREDRSVGWMALRGPVGMTAGRAAGSGAARKSTTGAVSGSGTRRTCRGVIASAGRGIHWATCGGS